MFETDKIKKRGHYIPSLFDWNCQEIQGFSFKKKEKKKIIPLWFFISSEVYLEFKWSSLDSGQDVSKITSRRIWSCVGTYLELRRDVPDATSGRNFGNSIGDYTGKNSIKNTAKNHQKRLSIAIFMAIYGRLWQLKSYCNIGTFS